MCARYFYFAHPVGEKMFDTIERLIPFLATKCSITCSKMSAIVKQPVTSYRNNLLQAIKTT